MKTLSIQEHGTMLSDYFHGTSGVMLPIYIDNKTTIKEALDMLEDEINMVWGHIEYTAEYHDFPLEDLDADIKSELERVKEYVNTKGTMNTCINPDLEDFDEDGPVLIFTIEFIED